MRSNLQPTIEVLETRKLMTADIRLVDDVEIHVTADSEEISISEIKYNDIVLAIEATVENLDTGEIVSQQFPPIVNKINVRAGDGNDVVRNNTSAPMDARGEGGNDLLRGRHIQRPHVGRVR